MTENRPLPAPNPEPQSPTSSSSGTVIGSVPPTPGRVPGDEYTRTPYDNILDPEEDLNCPLQGYPELAKQIADYPDFEAFQSFKDLSIKSLLYYQAELDELRKDLHKLEWRDFRTGQFDDAKEYCVRADYVVQAQNLENGERAKRQYALVTRIREVLKQYRAYMINAHLIILLTRMFATDEELLRYSKIAALPEADTFNVNSLHKWLILQSSEKRIQGPGAESWGNLEKDISPKPESLLCRTWRLAHSPFWTEKKEKPEFDLVVPRVGIKVDGLARWVANEFVPFWQYLKDHGWNQISVDEENGTNKVKEKVRRTLSTKGKRSCGGFSPFKSKTPQPKTTVAETPTINSYREGPMLRFTSFIATIIACLLPTVAIAVLAQLHTIGKLLGIIAVFTAVFAGGLMMLVDSGTSRVEIFTATAA
jgi:hypothetical protein